MGASFNFSLTKKKRSYASQAEIGAGLQEKIGNTVIG